ncbi:MAG: hypothetical protein ACO36A_08585 [Ilumatobacteraceae bacterium]
MARSTEVGIIGSGLIGTRVAAILVARGVTVRMATHTRATELLDCGTVVMSHGGRHAALAGTFLSHGVHVVSCGDSMSDVISLLDLDDRATSHGAVLVPGASCMPGLSGLLVAHASRAFDNVEEAHVAVHGTGGPACARTHHDALSGTSVGWHDGEWIQRPAGSGRELCWFPDPVGPRDCYRFGTAEPLLLQRVVPGLRRITARVSATRRDRLTARLPMMSPPHAEGGVGGLRVELRGTRQGARHDEIVGIADRLATVAGAVAAETVSVLQTSEVQPGVRVLGAEGLPNGELLDAVVANGITLHRYVGH